MPVPEHFHRFWCALDERIGHVQLTWWGAVVTDARFPAIWDANYARIDAASRDVTAADIEAVLAPALQRVGTTVMHVVSFHPEETADMLSELSGRGHRLSWDAVMDLRGDPPASPDIPVVEPVVDDAFWGSVTASFRLFGVEPEEASAQLLELERALHREGVKRWFAVRDAAGTPVATAALVLLDGVGYVDNVCTFPQARGRGYAGAVTARAAGEAREAGAGHVTLLVDPSAKNVIRLYERLGFHLEGRLATTRGSLPDQSGGGR